MKVFIKSVVTKSVFAEDTAIQNWVPDFRKAEGEDHHFITIFAIYFPSMTGVQSGANICGDLRVLMFHKYEFTEPTNSSLTFKNLNGTPLVKPKIMFNNC